MDATLSEITPQLEASTVEPGTVESDTAESGSIAYTEHLTIAPLPKSAHFTAGSSSLSQIGPVPVMRAAWGTPIATEEIATALVKAGRQSEVLSTLREIGFVSGYHFPIDTDMEAQRVQDLHVGYISGLVETVLATRGWDSVDALVICSHSIQQSVTGATADELARRGYQIERVYWYRLACNSTTAALVDFARDPDYYGRRVVLVGLDTLSGNGTDVTNPVTFATFGNAGGAIAFVPGVEIEFVTGRAVVEYDTTPFFTVPHAFNRPPASPRLARPAHYTLIGEETAQRFHATEQGLWLDSPADTALHMDGRRTYRYFASPAVVSLIWEVFNTYQAEFAERYGPLGVTVGHQPSKPVVDGLNRALFQLVLDAQSGDANGNGNGNGHGLSRQELRALLRADVAERSAYLERLGVPAIPLTIPWVMDATSINNVSSATSLVALEHLAGQRAIRPGTRHLVVGLGIGASYQAHVLRFR